MNQKDSKPTVKTLADKVHDIVLARPPLVNRKEPEGGPKPDGHIVIESDARTPHQSQWVQICLEIAQKREEDPLKKFFWVTVANRIKTAQQFQFGEVSDLRIKQEAKRAGPLIAAGHLDLPYDSVVYNYTLSPDPNAAFELQHERIKFCSLACKMDKEWCKDPLPGPLYAAADFIFAPTESFHVERKYAMILAAAVVFQAHDAYKKWKGEMIDVPIHRSSPFGLVSVADGIASLSMILATRGVETKRREPKERLQRARVKKNRSLFFRTQLMRRLIESWRT